MSTVDQNIRSGRRDSAAGYGKPGKAAYFAVLQNRPIIPMKVTLATISVCLSACISYAQVDRNLWGDRKRSTEREIIIERSAYQGLGLYYHTPEFNDIFSPNPYSDQFLLPDTDFYKEKKVARVTIFDHQGQPLFICNIGTDGLPVKTTTFDGLTRDQEFFYDKKYTNNLIVKTFRKDGQTIRVDSVKLSQQKKVINDTAYEYLVLRTAVYKTGRFLNEQNSFFNKTYGGDNSGNNFTLVVTPAAKKNAPSPSRPKLFACNYTPDKLYFSREEVTVENAAFTFLGRPFNPGEQALSTYAPECYPGIKTRHSNLPCENFTEPVFLRESMRCGYTSNNIMETTQYQSVRYSYTQNSHGLRDTCYHDSGGEKGLMYYFTYTYHE